MKSWVLALGLLIILISLLTGCSSNNVTGNSNNVTASLGQEFTLPIGQTVALNGEQLSFKFDKVIGDSRCPRGAQCIQAGDIKCQIQVNYSGSSSQLILTEIGNTSGYSHSSFNNYKIDFQVQPYPEVNKQPAASEYKLLMMVTK